MEIIMQLILIILMLLIIFMLRPHKKRKEKKNTDIPLIVDVEIPEEDVTPTLIQSLLSSNLAMKRKLITVIENGNMTESYRLQKKIVENNQFIVDLFEYDKKLKEKINIDNEEETQKEIKQSEPVLKNMLRKQRMDGKFAED